MCINFKLNEHSQKAVEWMSKNGEIIHLNKTTVSVNVKTSNQLVGSIQFIDKRIKIWKAGEPQNYIHIDFRDLVSVTEL